MKGIISALIFSLILIVNLSACKENTWNNPHKTSVGDNIRYASYYSLPKTLDPAVSYEVGEATFVAQIYEPVLQYHYLLRPYQLIPLIASKMPKMTYIDQHGHILPSDAPSSQVALTKYEIEIQPHVLYQPHPAFAKDEKGNYLYHHLTLEDLKSIYTLSDFSKTGTRELTADDYVYEIKRLASPRVNSPIIGLMGQYIVGFKDYTAILQSALNKGKFNNNYLDLRQYPIAGVKVLNRYSYEITIKGKYPQFIYWLAMTFFSPIPWEADLFYSQPGMEKKNLSFTWYPVGTGPYMLIENNPNKQIVLGQNPNFHGEKYPAQGSADDLTRGLLVRANKPMPFINKYVFTLEKEFIPRWSKFLQGYYDVSTIGSDSFEQAIKIDKNGQAQLTPDMKAKGIYLQTSISPSMYFFGFNMLDDTVGGYSENAQKLRQAISIALDIEEFIAIFLNGRGIPAQGPLPPGIFGYNATNIDPYIYDWRNNKPERKSIAYAKQLLLQAGYPNGYDSKTKKPLILNYDVAITSTAEQKSQLDWMREKFGMLGIQLNVRATQSNRFMEKLRTGNTQIFFFGWLPDYPDPENFLFLFYTPEGQVKYAGANYSNYSNPEYDKLFLQMRTMPNGAERQEIIDKMLAILHKDNPWAWGFYPKSFMLSQTWVGPAKLDAMGNNTLKYQWIDPKLREELQKRWNHPKLWPLVVLILFFSIGFLLLFINYQRKLRRPRIKRG